MSDFPLPGTFDQRYRDIIFDLPHLRDPAYLHRYTDDDVHARQAAGWYTIRAPVLAPGDLHLNEPTLVVPGAPERLVAAVYELARFFYREDGTVDSVGFHDPLRYPDDTQPDGWEAWLWNANVTPRPMVVGAAVFRRVGAAFPLSWVWMHPYARREGRLRGAWPTFRSRYGDFPVVGPISSAMQAFVATCDPQPRIIRVRR